MRQVLALCMTMVFVLGLAGAALAQGSQQPSSGSQSPSSSAPSPASPSSGGSSTDTTKSTAPAGKTDMGKPDASKTDKSAAGKPADKAGAARGQHKMMGEVTKIDSTKGLVTLKTDEGDMDLHFPPSALQGIKEGDRVEVQLAIRPAGAADAGSKPAAGKAPAAPKTDDAAKGSGKAPASTGAPQQPKTQ
jgi:Cu/Ag efflux protein CusF